jgi:hypothetical protein
MDIAANPAQLVRIKPTEASPFHPHGEPSASNVTEPTI